MWTQNFLLFVDVNQRARGTWVDPPWGSLRLLIGVRLVEAAGQITLILESAMIFARWETRAIVSNVDEMMV